MICFIIGIFLVQLCCAGKYSATSPNILGDIPTFEKDFPAISQMQCSVLCMKENCEIYEFQGNFYKFVFI